MNVTALSSAEQRHTDSLTKHADTKKLAVKTAPTMHHATMGAASTAKASRQLGHPTEMLPGFSVGARPGAKLLARRQDSPAGCIRCGASLPQERTTLLSPGRPERHADTKKLAVKTAPTVHHATVGAVSTAKAFSFFTAMPPARQLGSALGPHRRTRESSDGNASC